MVDVGFGGFDDCCNYFNDFNCVRIDIFKLFCRYIIGCFQ